MTLKLSSMNNSNLPLGGSAVYSVNMETLKINMWNPKSGQDGSCISNHENFDFNNSNSDPIPVSLEQLPVEHDGFMYFRSRDDAFYYIKMQIGM